MLRFPPTVPQNPPIFTPIIEVFSLLSVLTVAAVDFNIASEYTFSIRTWLLKATPENIEATPIAEFSIIEFFICKFLTTTFILFVAAPPIPKSEPEPPLLEIM